MEKQVVETHDFALKNRWVFNWNDSNIPNIRKISELKFKMVEGKITYKPLEITLYDELGLESYNSVLNIINNYKKTELCPDIKIILLNSAGEKIRFYNLVEPKIIEVSYGEFDYNKFGMLEIKFKIEIKDVIITESKI